MLKQIVSQALGAHDFKLVRADDVSEYYMREIGESIRFAVIHEIEGVTTPSELNVRILQAAPEEFSQHPAFKKNCDLICILKFGSLSEFKELEQKIFAIEEDAYHFKKYVLYYSDIEEQMLDDVSYEVLFDVISEKKEFDAYKANPLSSSKYSIAARIFIKLPFLELPYKEKELVPLGLQVEEAVKEFKYEGQYNEISSISIADADIDNLIKELIQDELENIQD
jgi:hypothetical protein